jgi:uncharacterized membrane protein
MSLLLACARATILLIRDENPRLLSIVMLRSLISQLIATQFGPTLGGLAFINSSACSRAFIKIAEHFLYDIDNCQRSDHQVHFAANLNRRPIVFLYISLNHQHRQARIQEFLVGGMTWTRKK